MEDRDKIVDVIEKLRPFLVTDGGDIEFVKYEDNIVYIKLLGACAGCSLIDYTLKDGIESAIKEEVPSVKEVVNVG
ncbi:MAG: NifU family protein [Bacilli bacterium]|nr:NifU family protein [Bacilli bacterium]MBR2841091.1 NifU family protein [Bacilli bacterium]